MKKINKLHWAEMVTPNTKEVATFYSEVIGLKLDEVPDEDNNISYEVRDDKGEDVIGICSSATFPETPSGWLPYIEVFNIEESAKKVQSNGGLIISDSAEHCLIEDPAGHRMMLTQTNK